MIKDVGRSSSAALRFSRIRKLEHSAVKALWLGRVGRREGRS